MLCDTLGCWKMSQMFCREVVKCLRRPRKCCLCYFEYEKDKLCVMRLEDLTVVLLNTGVFWDMKGHSAFVLRVTHSDLLGLLDFEIYGIV